MREDINKILREPHQENAVCTKKANKPRVEFEDVILLTSAEALRGKITKNIPEKSVTILLNDQTSRTVERSEISQILKEKKRYYASKTGPKSSVATEQNKGNGGVLQGIIELGSSFGFRENELSPIQINIIAAAGFSGFGSVGGKFGLRCIADGDKLLLPIFADFRVSPFDNKVSPFAGIRLDTTVQTAEGTDYFSGLFFHAQMGLEIAKRKKSGVMLSVGFEQFNVQKKEVSGILFPVIRVKTRSVQTLTVNIAFRF